MKKLTRHQFASLSVALLATIAISIAGCDSPPTRDQPVSVVFRYDDYSEVSPTDLEVGLIRAFEQRGVPITFAVIPFRSPDESQADVPLGPAKAAILKDAVSKGVIEVALHGHSHRTIRTVEPFTEFEGVDYDRQKTLIANAKSFLEERLGLPITLFVPPWNTYDSATLRVLEEAGVTTISADRDGEIGSPSHLKFLPFTTRLRFMRRAVAVAASAPNGPPHIVVLFHPFDFTEVDPEGTFSLPRFVELLDWTLAQPHVKVTRISDAVSAADLDANRMLGNRTLSPLTPTFLIPPGRSDLYLPSASPQSLHLRTVTVYVVTFLVAMAVAITMARVLLPKRPTAGLAARYGFGLLALLTAAYALRGGSLQFKGAIAITATLAAAIGVWLPAGDRHRRSSSSS